MELTQALQKLNSIRAAPQQVIFGYRYFHSKIDGYVSLTDLRLEALQIGEKLLYTMAAPVLEVKHGKSFIDFHDKDIVLPTTGDRAGILLRACYLKEGEAASPATGCGTVEINEDSDPKHLLRAVEIYEKPAFPGTDMRLPAFYRCTKNPSRLRLNYAPDLLAALELENGVSAEELKKVFMEKLDTVAAPTNDGWVVPFEWVYAGGMVVAAAENLGKKSPKIWYTRSLAFFQNFIKAHGWNITCS